MDNKIPQLLEHIREINRQIEIELELQRARFEFILEKKKIWFNDQALRHHIQLRYPLTTYLWRARRLAILSAPFIYILILPLSILDLLLVIYQYICFPIYGIRKVCRDEYIVIDRGALAYLNAIEKINCLYCGYATGLLALAKEVASRTEAHWCPIKHARKVMDPPPRYFDYAEFGDPDGYRQRMKEHRSPPPADQNTNNQRTKAQNLPTD